MLFLFFLAIPTSGHRSRPDPRCGQGEGEANSLWIQWTNVDPNGKSDEWGYNKRRGGDVYGVGKQDHITKIRFSHVVPSLKLVASKGDPMGLGYKVNHQIGQRRREYKPSSLFLPNPSTNPRPKVSMISKQKYPNTQ